METKKINDTQAIILGVLLNQGSLSGSEVYNQTSKLDGFWTTTRSQVYRELPVMASIGLLTAGPLRGKKERHAQPFAITDLGIKVYDEWLNNYTYKIVHRDPWMLRYKMLELSGSVDPAFVARATEFYQILAENEPDPLLRDLAQLKAGWYSARLS